MHWGHAALSVLLDESSPGPVALRAVSGDGVDRGAPASAQPLVELLVAGCGRARSTQRYSQTVVGRRLRHVDSERSRDGRWHLLRVLLRDSETDLGVEVFLRSMDGIGAVQTWVRVTNHGPTPVMLLAVTSYAAGLSGHRVDDLDVVWADSEWLGESRWHRRPLREAGIPDLNLPAHGQDGRGRFALTSTGAWSTGRHLPTGGLVDRTSGETWLWQVEHNGAWHWEVGEQLAGAYVALLGPTDAEHQWSQTLHTGQSFSTVPVSVAVSPGGLDGAVAALTAHRRAITRPQASLPVVFNDYMNTLMGDPTTAKLLPLVDAAAGVGAQVFCIDAGWYDDDGAWWDSVGEWQPSQTRFPRGIDEVIQRIRARHMVAGLWLEPEVIGVRSPVADKLPREAFMQRGGTRLVEHGRYHLDLRHPAAVAHLDEVVDRLVEELGVGYFKLDYNIDPGPGTDIAADSPGAGLLGHNRAYVAWLDRVRQRHPELILENCASGAMRMDYALLSRLHLQSTSDQQDFLRASAIAVAAPMSILPEQSANWSYPQPDMTPEEIAFTLCTGLLGRLYLSGNLHALTDEQGASVAAAVRVYRDIRADLARAVPVWPLGLPRWTDRWLSLALHSPAGTYLGVWRRPGAGDAVTLCLPALAGRDIAVEVLYPDHLPRWNPHWDTRSGDLTLAATGDVPAARLFRLTP
ncbi:MAG: alpha-galactosidase [Micromonosporaceae bacterium]